MQLQKMKTLRDWHFAVRVAHKAHIKAAARADRLNKALGIPATVLSAVVGTAVFVSLEKEVGGPTGKILIGLLSVAAAVLASLQTHLHYSENAELHRKAAGRYGVIRRELEALLATYTDTNPCDCAELEPISLKWAELEASAPSLSQRLYVKLEKQIREEMERQAKTAS
jgi:hypothetical protein